MAPVDPCIDAECTGRSLALMGDPCAGDIVDGAIRKVDIDKTLRWLVIAR